MATANWWNVFLDDEGRDSEEEAAFNGYLTTHEIPAFSDPGVLQQAYVEFRAWWIESQERQADLGPSREELAAKMAVVELEKQFIAKSRVSAPGVEKPKTAATRPKETREELAGGGPGPGGEANLTPASGPEPQQHPAVQATGTQPDPNQPNSPDPNQPNSPDPNAPESGRGRYGRRSEGGAK